MTPPFVDYYGTKIEVEGLMGGPGPLVDVEIGTSSDDAADDRRLRFTADGACDFADAILRAAGWPEKASRP